jgi:hypothetical protein
MNGVVLASILILISITFSASYGFFEQGWQNLFCKVAVFGLSDIIECDNMKDTLTFKAGQDIDISLDSATDTITIAAIVQKFNENGTNLGTSGATIFRGESNHIWNFARIYNGTNTIITENTTGVIISAAMDSSGEANTGANVGTGEGTVFRDKTGTTLNFKSLKQSDNIVLTNNADDVTIRGINTAQIVSAGGTSLFKSKDNATQNTIKGLTTTRGITLTANTDDVQIDTNFKVNSKSSATRQFLTSFNNATTDGNFGTITFGINTKICSGTDKISAIDNATGAVTCSADQTGGVSDGDKGDITVSGGGATWTIDNDVVTYAKMQNIVNNNRFLGRISGAGGDPEELTGTQATSLLDTFTSSLKGLVPSSGGGTTNFLRADGNWATPSGFTTITNLAGGTAKILATNSSNKAEFKSLTQGQGISITNGSSTVTVATNFKIDNLSNTCSGTDKVSAITFNNSTGDWTVTCSADQTGGGNGGSGIPYNKLWGSFVARSTSGALDGFLTGATLDGTETYTYDTTMASSVISSASGTTAGNNAGLSQVATNTNVFRLDQNALLYAEWRMTEITTNRIFIGFQSGTTALPNASDDMLNAASGYGLCIQSTDTVYQVCRNDGSGATVFASLGVTEDTNRHTVLIKADSANNRWCISLDGATDTCHTTDIPAATTRLYVSVSGETTDTSGTTFIYSKVYVQNDR